MRDVSTHLRELDARGFTTFENLLSPSDVEEARYAMSSANTLQAMYRFCCYNFVIWGCRRSSALRNGLLAYMYQLFAQVVTTTELRRTRDSERCWIPSARPRARHPTYPQSHCTWRCLPTHNPDPRNHRVHGAPPWGRLYPF